jgi:hypothetical protein
VITTQNQMTQGGHVGHPAKEKIVQCSEELFEVGTRESRPYQ